MPFIKCLFLIATLSLLGCGKAPEMPDYNKTASVPLLDNKDEKIFFLLPLSGRAQDGTKLWSGDFWASNQGSVNKRWHSLLQDGFNLVSPTREVVLNLSYEELAQLAPSEKFDLFLGRYDYPLKEEVDSRANRYALDSEGLCNGWSLASLNHNEPLPKTLANPDGVIVPFASADIKALVSYYYSFTHTVNTTSQLGHKNELNPGSFHIVLANRIGKKGKSFLVDIDRSKEVWNHPVVSYKTTILGDIPLKKAKVVPGTVRILNVKTLVTFVDESVENSWDPILNTPLEKYLEREYAYHIFLSMDNTIIGGEWTSRDRPDSLWNVGPTEKFTGLLEGLHVLLND